MTALFFARTTMAFSLAFHIIFAAIGMTIPFFMAISYWLYLKKAKPEDLALTKMWSKGTAVLFATGAVSGTVLSFELGLLWPKFMKFAGPIFGMPFSWEGTAFFLEAIAIGFFLYGWDKVNRWVHWGSALLVGVTGFASGIFVVSANAWMNAPAGFDFSGASQVVDPLAAMFNKAWFHQALHMQLAALAAVGFAVAGVHAYLLLKKINPSLNIKALKIAMSIGSVAALILPLSGHYSAQWLAENQPIKLAAMEAHFKTSRDAPVIIGGLADPETQSLSYAIKIPYALSLLAFNDPHAEVKGLDSVDKEDWPPINITHMAFQLMVALGTLMALMASLFLFFQVRSKNLPKWYLRLLACLSPIGFIAIEAGWVVTEVGRQPWIIYGYMKTKDAVTEVGGLEYHFILFLILYGALSFACFKLMKRIVHDTNARYRGES